MFDNKYENEKKSTIKIYRQYVNNRKKFQEVTLTGDGLNDEDLKQIEIEVDKLEKNEYLLTIVGESKSGKSCFINALLGKAILPTDILQCTSGITEITDTSKNEEKKSIYLNVTYAHAPKKPKQEFSGTLANDLTPLKEKLKEIAAIKEKYRCLPTLQLNQFLVEEKPEHITSELIIKVCNEFVSDTYNPHKLSKEKFNDLVTNYLIDYQDLTKIPVYISIGFPLGFNFSHMQIIDTPGVNARGGVEQATLKYIDRANAAIFIHQLKNIASSSLREFFKSVPKRTHKNSFMCLTHKAYQTVEQVEQAVVEAKKLFPEIQPEERIVAVDSMLKFIHDELDTGKQPADLMKDEETKKLLAVFYFDYEADKAKIQDALLADSNFGTVKNLLSKFSETALCGQLREVLEPIEKAYEEQQKLYDELISKIGWKAEYSKTQEEFEQELDKLNRLLNDYKKALNTFAGKIRPKYAGRGSDAEFKFSVIKASYDRLLESASSEDQICKYINDYNDDCDKEITYFTMSLQREFAIEMDKLGAEFKASYSISLPKINLSSVSEGAKRRAYENITIPSTRGEEAFFGALKGALGGFLSGGPVGAISGIIGGAVGGYIGGSSEKIETRFNDQTYKREFIRDARTLVSSITGEIQLNIGAIFDKYNEDFNEKLKIIIQERQNAYKALATDLDNVKKLEQYNKETILVANELKEIKNINELLPST